MKAQLLWILLPLLAGCKTRLWELPIDGGVEDMEAVGWDMAPPKQTLITTCREGQPVTKIDLLFQIDNSGSMEGMQIELRKRFPEFFQVFVDLAAKGTDVDLHVGVVTSDYGAGKIGNSGCGISPGGQKGILQAIGAEPPPGCKPPVGDRFVRFAFHGTNNLPQGQDLVKTFTCMASVGARGCGAEHVLEATYAALHNDIPENRGFLRDDALLAIVFVTNEDDCSAPPDSDLFDPNKTSQYGPNNSFRCTRFGVLCGHPPVPPSWDGTGGPVAGCVPAPNPNGAGPGKLFDVSRYTNYFHKPAVLGGVKRNPFDVMMVGIHAPVEPFQTVVAHDEDPEHNYLLCSQRGAECVPVLDRSCHNQLASFFFGDPAVRLSSVIQSAPNHGASSICEGDYSGAFGSLAKLIVADLGQCCMPEVLPPDPMCTVDEVIQEDNGSTRSESIPKCGTGAVPCWKIEMKKECAGQSPQGIAVAIDRGGQPAPAHSTVRASCEPQK